MRLESVDNSTKAFALVSLLVFAVCFLLGLFDILNLRSIAQSQGFFGPSEAEASVSRMIGFVINVARIVAYVGGGVLFIFLVRRAGQPTRFAWSLGALATAAAAAASNLLFSTARIVGMAVGGPSHPLALVLGVTIGGFALGFAASSIGGLLAQFLLRTTSQGERPPVSASDEDGMVG